MPHSMTRAAHGRRDPSAPARMLARLALLVVLPWLTHCATAPSLEGVEPSYALPPAATAGLDAAVLGELGGSPDVNGVRLVEQNAMAFAYRASTAAAAERSLDVQYYIWNDDLTGRLLAAEVLRAAERGVRVRVMVDDIDARAKHDVFLVADLHPNIEVRLFNPFPVRRPRLIGYLTDFPRLNQRMHNKSFTADNQATIVGGRNVGDEYFGATAEVEFVDLDVLAVGPVVREVSDDFDRYWASASSYPADRLLPPADPASIDALGAADARIGNDPAAAAYVRALRESPFVGELIAGRAGLEWAATRLVSDDPAKGLGRAAPNGQLPEKLAQIIGASATHVELVSAYFVPTAAGVDAFAALAKRGVKIRVLTNSLEATDVTAVHAGYAKRRKPLLDAGVLLYESKRVSPNVRIDRHTGLTGSSASSLHAKTFAVDRARLFVGSFNFDPRSARLNTELGFVIDSPVLAQQIEAAFDGRIPETAYEVRLENGRLYWLERRDGQLFRHDTEPGTGPGLRTGVWLMSVLPIEWLL